MAKYVVSLGGNALGNNPIEQKQALIKVAKAITDLIMGGNEVAIVHGKFCFLIKYVDLFNIKSELDCIAGSCCCSGIYSCCHREHLEIEV